jgi:hypothetical protein
MEHQARFAWRSRSWIATVEEIQLRGRVVERRADPDLKIMDPVSQKYIGKPFPMRSSEGQWRS